jgi:uncharacterized protein GlcG (DUF336 family)
MAMIERHAARAVLLAALAATALMPQAASAQAAAPLTFSARSLTPQGALRIAQAALASCARAGYNVAVAVSDRAGYPLVMLRDRLAGPHTPEVAANKAYTAITFKSDTLALARFTQAGEAGGIRHVARVVAVGGGRFIEAAGSVVGGIGVSGAPGGEADDVCARAGIAAVQDDLELQ